ncbi:uncharacterized protein [Haliotis cracherodii]|uniref:uncharacterized protein n=1 Tax=Haliotis cracherodii TaxID=6455 RepID=UPI0039E8B148
MEVELSDVGQVNIFLGDVPNYENEQTNASQSDVISILMEKAPYLSSSQLKLIQAQLQNSSVNDKHSRRWDSDIIQLTLSLWTRSPKTYEQLLKSGCLVLPSISTLSRYKNVVEQHAGTNNDVFKWMYMEACSRNLPKHGYYGGLVLDEMSIQEDLQIVKKGGQIKLVGFPDIVKSSNGDTSFANHVLQYVFHGFTGFRFPIAHFPTTQANAPQLYSSFWDIISSLESWGFHVLYVSIDGASTNRSFIKLHFDGSPGQFDMATHNPFSDNPVIFLADPSHLFKKIRNNLLKSGPEKWHSRELTINGHPIVWKMWIDSYEWDKQHGLSIHHKLGNDHIHPNKADLMRNHLAEEVLDSNMLSLMRLYKQNLGHGSSVLEGAVDLLEQTSTLISIFHDRRPIRDLTDIRLHQLRTILQWFRKWEESETRQHLMSWETREDVEFLLSGFCKLAHVATQDLKITLTPLYINSDIVENHFSQQRGLYHGSGANPNYNQYRTATNSIILGQSTISNKSNASRRNTLQSTGAMPFSHLCKKIKV